VAEVKEEKGDTYTREDGDSDRDVGGARGSEELRAFAFEEDLVVKTGRGRDAVAVNREN
jgi:hypothetical protein